MCVKVERKKVIQSQSQALYDYLHISRINWGKSHEERVLKQQIKRKILCQLNILKFQSG